MGGLSGTFRLASSDSEVFSESRNFDILVSTTSNIQNILLGSEQEGVAALRLSDSNITVRRHILPASNEVYDLGSSNLRFKDLYLSGNTLNIGGATLSTGNDGSIQTSSNFKINGYLSGPYQQAFVVDEKGAGVDGGTQTTGDWVRRTLNTIKYSTINLALSSNMIELEPGVYHIVAAAPSATANGHVIRLMYYDVNVGTVTQAALGTSGMSYRDYGARNTLSEVNTILTLPQPATGTGRMWRVYVEQVVAGGGNPGSAQCGHSHDIAGVNSIYTTVHITKISNV